MSAQSGSFFVFCFVFYIILVFPPSVFELPARETAVYVSVLHETVSVMGALYTTHSTRQFPSTGQLPITHLQLQTGKSAGSLLRTAALCPDRTWAMLGKHL